MFLAQTIKSFCDLINMRKYVIVVIFGAKHYLHIERIVAVFRSFKRRK